MTAKEMIVLMELLHDECKLRSSCDSCPLLLIEDEVTRVCAVSTGFPENWPVRMLQRERSTE